ncbi:hypothetical protein [Mycobacterium terramassiliense]|uniref:Mycobacterium terramassiliense ORFan n=1 Tax=Mycobacterium terramassiliense TaxID=1841859 RepID=A0A2U3NJ64_9MYCO|nr:hypothetical protein [Mycobacterium terramassiliense]SPM31579.1 Mycobacterium terramassiliense ORFan [Mycobacterium terramassiliense]
MTQPSYIVPPNAQAAQAVRSSQIPARWTSSVAYRDFLLNAFTNGVTQDQAGQHIGDLFDKVALALMETITRVNALEQR